MRSAIGMCLVLWGCGFTGGGASTEPDAGADGAVDAPADAAPVVLRLRATGATAQGSILGGAIGNQKSGLVCPTGELPIGAAFDLTDNPIAAYGNQRVVSGVRLRCGRIEQIDGVFQVTPTGQRIILGASVGCAEYVPATTSPEARCPTGSVLVGFDGNRPGAYLFNHVALRCAPLVAGVLSLPISKVDVAGTGTDATLAQSAQCPAQTALVVLKPYASCGVEGIIPSCAPVALAP